MSPIPAAMARALSPSRVLLIGALLCVSVTVACGENATRRSQAPAPPASPAALAARGTPTPVPAAPAGPAELASQGNVHVNPGGQHVPYSTDPPASGPHFPTVPRRGIYTMPFVTEYLPHFLEHGGVEVLYNKTASADVVKALTDVVSKELGFGIGQVLLAPRPDMPCQVTLTAWQRIEAFGAAGCQPGSLGHEFDPTSSADSGAIKTFVERNMCAYDPENQCGRGPHGQLTYPTPSPGDRLVTANLAGQPPQPVNTVTATPASATPQRALLTPGPRPAIATPAPLTGTPAGITTVVLTLDLAGVPPAQTDQVVRTAVEVMKGRLSAAGVKQANVTPGANGQITVEALDIPPEAAKPLLGATGHLAFMEPVLDPANRQQARDAGGQPKWQPACFDPGCPNGEPELTGRFLLPTASVGTDAVGRPDVNFELGGDGPNIFGAVTQRNLGKPIAIFFDGVLLTAPVVQSPIRDQGVIAGPNIDAQRLVAQLNGGELPVPAKNVETR